MEVHQHTHTERKKWTHYLWEFLMLFLAVFCGFLAENQRDHMVEKKREKQFIFSLVNDLQLDTAWFRVVRKSEEAKMQNFDSAILFMSELKNNQMPVRIYQYLQRGGTNLVIFLPFNGTITQLKSSGGLRLITKKEAVAQIEDYDRQLRRLDVRRDITNQIAQHFAEALDKTVAGNDLVRALYDSVFYHKKIVQSQTIHLNNQNLDELINASISMRLRAVSDTATNGTVQRQALRLIEFLKKEYHLK